MKILCILLTTCAFIFFACNNEKKDTTTTDTDTTLKITEPPEGRPDTTAMAFQAQAKAIIAETKADTVVTGTATFDTTSGGKVKMVLELTIPAKAGSSVAVHIHEHGDCSDKGEMAHGHWNPGKTEHGKWGTGSFHMGDIGNVKLDSKGKGTLTIETDLWSLGGNSSKNILKKAIIVHSGTDDYKTQPGGNAGSRIGCGIIQ